MTDLAPDPWERTPGETDNAFGAFVIYRDMGPQRSLAKAGRELGKTKPVLEEWSRNNHWVVRCEAWDDELDRERRAEQIQAVRSMAARHVAIAHQMLEKVVARLQSLDAATLTPHQLARFARDAVTIERLALGQPTAVDPANGETDEDVERSLVGAMTAYLDGVRDGAATKVTAAAEAEA